MKSTVKRVAALVIILIAAFVRNSVSLPNLFGGRALILIPAVVSLALFESEIPALLFGFAAGVMWDLSSGAADGIFTLYLGIAGVAASLLVKFVLRRKVTSALTVSAVFLFFASVVMTISSASGVGDFFYIFFTLRLPSAIAAEISVFAFYYIFRFLYADKNYGRVEITGDSR